MSDNAELIIRNDRLGEIISRALAETRPSDQHADGLTVQQHGEDLIATYALDMVLNGYKADVSLDFTYDTLRLLPVAVRRCLVGYQEGGNSFRDSVEALAKSFAAYIFCLAMNEHDCPWNVQQLRTRFTPPDKDFGPLWANAFRITTGLRRQTDFLIPALEGGMGEIRNGKGFMILNVAPTVKAYKAAFRVDLNEHGLSDIATEVFADK